MAVTQHILGVILEEVTFDRPKKYSVIRELGSGACGRTLLLYDSDLDLEVVAKKYAPLPELDAETKKEFLVRFRKEAQILLRATHENVVRVFTYYDYPEAASAYFIMEYVDGSNIIDYAKNNPSSCESLFLETISGFSYLSSKGITHRDIRPLNILVASNGRVKIIDFGFAKAVRDEAGHLSAQYLKSVTLNWWANRPRVRTRSCFIARTRRWPRGRLRRGRPLGSGRSAWPHVASPSASRT